MTKTKYETIIRFKIEYIQFFIHHGKNMFRYILCGVDGSKIFTMDDGSINDREMWFKTNKKLKEYHLSLEKNNELSVIYGNETIENNATNQLQYFDIFKEYLYKINLSTYDVHNLIGKFVECKIYYRFPKYKNRNGYYFVGGNVGDFKVI